MKEKKLIVLEGISGAGKSTNINILLNTRDDVDAVNIKISKLLENVEKTNRIDYSNTDYYLLLEMLKTIIFQDSQKEFVVWERNYLSTLAHAYAMGVKTNNFSEYEKVLSWYETNINKNLIKPDAYIYIDIPLENSIKRIKQRNESVVNDVWIEKEYMKICEKFKLDFIAERENQVKMFYVDGTKEIRDVNKQIIEIIEKL